MRFACFQMWHGSQPLAWLFISNTHFGCGSRNFFSGKGGSQFLNIGPIFSRGIQHFLCQFKNSKFHPLPISAFIPVPKVHKHHSLLLFYLRSFSFVSYMFDNQTLFLVIGIQMSICISFKGTKLFQNKINGK